MKHAATIDKQKLSDKSSVVHTFHSILDHFIQPLIDGIIHVVPFRDLTPFVFSVTYYSTTINTNGNSKQ